MMKPLKALLSWTKRHKQLLSVSLGIIFLVVVVYYIVHNINDFAEMSIQNWWLLAVIFISVLVRNFSTGLVMDTVLRPIGIRLSLTESFGLANLTRLVNQVLPGKVGIVMRSVYLKTRHGLSYASFASSFTASQLVLYFISSVLGVIAYIVISQIEQGQLNPLFLIGLLVAVIVLALTWIFPQRWVSRVKHDRLRAAIRSWYDIRSDNGTLWSLTIWSLLFIAASAVIMYSSFGSLGYPISVSMAVFFSSINIVNALIAITPAGFGISEGIIVILATSAGMPASVGLAAALLQRVVTFFAVIIVAPYYSQKLFHLGIIDLVRNRFKR